MKKRIWLLAALVTLLMTGCLKEGTGTIVLMGTESDVMPIDQVIPDTLLKFIVDSTEMMDTILVLPTGIKPPNIQGEYMFYPRRFYRDNGFHVMATDTVCFRFGGESDTLGCYPEGQHNMIVPCDFYGDIMESGNVFLVKSQPHAYVMGEGNDFTAYFKISYEHCEEPISGAEFTLTRGYILTGTVTTQGIENAVLACVNISAEQNGVQQNIPPEAIAGLSNRIFIYRVQGDAINPFGTAPRQKWY